MITRVCLLIRIWVSFLVCVHPVSGEVVNAADLGAKADSGEDATPAVRAAVERCRQIHAEKLRFAPGRYDFWPDLAEERLLFITNNDPGLRRIAFALTSVENLEIDGGGAQFVFHGNILPFVLDHSRNVFLHHFSIDWARPFHSEASVLKADPDGVDLQITAEFPYQIDHGKLVFLDEKKMALPLAREVLAFDPLKRETAFMAKDQGTGPAMRAREIAPGRVRLEEKIVAEPGNVLVFTSGERLCPAITLSDAEATRLLAVDIFHAGGMGVVAQRSRDVTLEQVRVTPPPGGKRVCSLTADATHFANCSGQITMEHCLFENQMDDATNIHGIYSRVSRRIGDDGLEVELVHPQQRGFDYLAVGERLELVHAGSMNTYSEAVVKSVMRMNDQFTHITLETALPAELIPGDVVAGDWGVSRRADCPLRHRAQPGQRPAARFARQDRDRGQRLPHGGSGDSARRGCPLLVRTVGCPGLVHPP